MNRRRAAGFGIDVWPVVADCFIGVFGMYVVVSALASQPPPAVDQGLEKAREELLKKLETQRKDGEILDYCYGPASVRIIYPEETLSFKECLWDLPPEGAERVRGHLREAVFGELAKEKRIAGLRIEGHADSRRAGGCQRLAPFRDNLQLSQNRARAVFDALLAADSGDAGGYLEEIQQGKGPPPPFGLEYVRELLWAGKVSVAGFGAMKPYQKLNPDCSSANSGSSLAPDATQHRRVEVTVDLAGASATPNAQASDQPSGSDARATPEAGESAEISPMRRPALDLARRLETTLWSPFVDRGDTMSRRLQDPEARVLHAERAEEPLVRP